MALANYLLPGLAGGIGTGFLAGGNMLDSFLHPEKAYKAAEKPLSAAYEEGKGFGIPFWQAGLDQRGRLMGAEDALLDPAALEAKWASGYQTSPFARQLIDQAKTSGLDAASSMGLLGSSAAVNNIQQGASQIAEQDRQNYLNDLMQKFMTGIGIGRDIYGTGATTAANLGQQAGQYGANLAGLEYARKAAPGQTAGNLINTGTNILSMLLG